MARTIFVTKQYVNGQINNEATSRITADTAIEKDINTQSAKIAVNATGIAGLNTAITTETTQRLAQTGNLAFNSNLKNADTSAVANLTEAVNATVI